MDPSGLSLSLSSAFLVELALLSVSVGVPTLAGSKVPSGSRQRLRLAAGTGAAWDASTGKPDESGNIHPRQEFPSRMAEANRVDRQQAQVPPGMLLPENPTRAGTSILARNSLHGWRRQIVLIGSRHRFRLGCFYRKTRREREHAHRESPARTCGGASFFGHQRAKSPWQAGRGDENGKWGTRAAVRRVTLEEGERRQ